MTEPFSRLLLAPLDSMPHTFRKLLLLSLALLVLPLCGSAPLLPPANPPSRSDILGHYEWTTSSSFVNFASGQSFKDKGTLAVQIVAPTSAEGGSNVVELIIQGQFSQRGRYDGGYLMLGSCDTNDPLERGEIIVMQMTGQPGKIKAKGEGLIFSSVAGLVGKSKFKMKQVPGPR